MNEKFLLCDMKSLKTKTGDNLFYIIVYSNLTEDVEKIYISMEDYEFLQKMNGKIDINNNLTRYYNAYKKKFAVKFTRV